MAQKMHPVMRAGGVIKRLKQHPGKVGKAADRTAGRPAMTGQVDADQCLVRAKRLFQRGPALAVGGETVQQDNRDAASLALADMQRAGLARPVCGRRVLPCGQRFGPNLKQGHTRRHIAALDTAKGASAGNVPK